MVINDGEIHVIMGPNGTGKSTLSRVIMGDPNYIVTSGSIFYNDTDLLKLNISERARLGIYLLNQSPIETTDVTEDPFKNFGSEVVLTDDDLPF